MRRAPLMSEPLSSSEIEDVLSSIRRLVSDDIRPLPKALAPMGDKLILTPALRVVQTEPEAAGPMPIFVAVQRSRLIDTPRSALGDVVASVGAAVDASPDDWEAETGDSAPVPDLPPDAGGSNPWALPAQEAFAEDSAPSEVAEVAAAEMRDTEAGAAPQDHFEYHAPEAAAPVKTPAWAQEDDITQEDEAEAAPLQGTVEPDPVWADAAEASVLAELAEPGAAEDEFDQAMRFDEDVLRELVRDMLREELAGKMGERITRNIRKLVRAEIARALAAQEFE